MIKVVFIYYFFFFRALILLVSISSPSLIIYGFNPLSIVRICITSTTIGELKLTWTFSQKKLQVFSQWLWIKCRPVICLLLSVLSPSSVLKALQICLSNSFMMISWISSLIFLSWNISSKISSSVRPMVALLYGLKPISWYFCIDIFKRSFA